MQEVIFCECGSMDHQIAFFTIDFSEEEKKTYSPRLLREEEDTVFIRVHLPSVSLWRRLKYGIRYIFGYKSNLGAWPEIITSKEKLKNSVGKL